MTGEVILQQGNLPSICGSYCNKKILLCVKDNVNLKITFSVFKLKELWPFDTKWFWPLVLLGKMIASVLGVNH